jgi:hypothetical protein
MTKSTLSMVDEIVKKHGKTFSEELGINIEKNTPSPLFCLLTFAILSSARISHQAALKAAKALYKEGWKTPEKMSKATWRQRTDVLNRSGYARYDESTSRMLEDTAKMLLQEYQGDLRKLRVQADQNPEKERKLLKKFKGLGDVGVDIFFREVQIAWDELIPFADKLVLKAAERLNLGKNIFDLQKKMKKNDFIRLIAGLIRIELENDYHSFAKG